MLTRDQEAGGSSLARSLALVLIVTCVHVGLTSRLSLFGVRPDIMLLTSIVMGLLAGSALGTATGFAAGLSFDLFVGTPFGLSALVDGLAGYITGYARDRVLPAARDFPITVILVVSLAAPVLFAAGLAVFHPEAIPTPSRLGRVACGVGIWNVVLATPMRFAARRVLGVRAHV